MSWIDITEMTISLFALGIGIYIFIQVKKKYDTGCGGCLAAIVFLAIFVWVAGSIESKISTWHKARLAEKAKQAELENAQKMAEARIAEEKRQKAEAKRRQEAKDGKIQTFALKDAPKVWAVYQSLQSEIDVQSAKIKELQKTLVAFGKEPEQDADFKRICALRDDMVRSKTALRAKLEDAYIAARKYEASPSRKDYQELHKKALEDGILEADAAEAKFKEMRLNK